jgi:hypothetical protein
MRFCASHRQSGYAKATSSSTARAWSSSPNRQPPLRADLKQPGTVRSFTARPPLRRPTAFDPEPVLCHLPEHALITKYFVDHLGSFPDLSFGQAPQSAFGRTMPP